MRRALQLAHRSFPSLPHFAQLSALLGARHATNETGWMMEAIVGKQRYDQFRLGRTAPTQTVQAAPRSESAVSSALSAAELQRLDSMMHARAVLRQPLQYLLGSVSFLGLPLMTRAPILIPRPETECIIGWILARWARRDYTQRYTHMQIQRETNLSDVSVWSQQANKRRQEHPARGAEAAAIPAAASPSSPPLRVLDLCSGSGNIALSLAHHLPSATHQSVHVSGVDVNPAAIALAQDNLAELQKQGLCLSYSDEQLQRTCSFAQVDLMQKQSHDDSPEATMMRRMRAQHAAQDPLLAALADPPAAVAELVRLAGAPSPPVSRSLLPLATLGGPYDLLVSNPPYIPFREHATLQSEVRDWEDFAALVAGEEGMDLYDQILRMIPSLMAARQATEGERRGTVPEVVLELGSATQALTLADRLQALGFNFVTIHHDLADLPRWIAAARTGKRNL